MKRSRRQLARAAGCLAIVLVGALLVVLDGVDTRPYFHELYYTETQERLRQAVVGKTVSRGDLLAGFGSARLTPSLNADRDDPPRGRFRALPLAGYGDRAGKPATGIRDELFAKAVALRVGEVLGVFVTADALIIPREVTAAVAAELAREPGLARERIYLSATHTHCSLGGWGEGVVAEAFAGAFQPGVREWFAGRIVEAVREAVADLKPASYGEGRFHAPQHIRNRLVGDLGKTDSEFSYLVFRQNDGELAVLGSYAAHATVLPSGVMEFSGDYPGAWQREIEEATGGIALFLAGGMGSHSPVAGSRGFDGAKQMGKALAQPLLEQLPSVSLTNTVSFGVLGLELSLPSLSWRVTDSIRLRPWLAERILGTGDRTFVQVFRLDDTVWISSPCDFSGELALEIKDFLRARDRNAVVTSFNGDYVGYVIPLRYYHLSGYESRIMSFFGPNLPAYLNGVMREMSWHLLDLGETNRAPTRLASRPASRGQGPRLTRQLNAVSRHGSLEP